MQTDSELFEEQKKAWEEGDHTKIQATPLEMSLDLLRNTKGKIVEVSHVINVLLRAIGGQKSLGRAARGGLARKIAS